MSMWVLQYKYCKQGCTSIKIIRRYLENMSAEVPRMPDAPESRMVSKVNLYHNFSFQRKSKWNAHILHHTLHSYTQLEYLNDAML